MPIIIKDFEWSETENTLIIKVPLRGVHPSKTDIFYSEFYIKASFGQYFFEVFLLQSIIPTKSKCTFASNLILFELIKNEPQIWTKLEPEISNTEKQKLKKKYIEVAHEKIQKQQEEMKNKKAELKRVAVREQMVVDANQHETIDNIKKEEKENALKSMNLLEKPQKSLDAQKFKSVRKKKQVEKPPPASDTSKIPPPRNTQTLYISFTPREFPTPCRESRLDEENEWLTKQAEARRSVGFISEDLPPEEHNPQFLKCKADEFLRNKNYLAAISAYSFGIKLNDKFADLYVGRAEAHFALGNFNKTVQDSTSALDLMKPAVPANLRERALCIGIRGVALINLGLIKQGIDELKASVTLVPNENFSAKLEEAIDKLHEVNDNE